MFSINDIQLLIQTKPTVMAAIKNDCNANLEGLTLVANKVRLTIGLIEPFAAKLYFENLKIPCIIDVDKGMTNAFIDIIDYRVYATYCKLKGGI